MSKPEDTHTHTVRERQLIRALVDENSARKVMEKCLEKYHPPKGRDWIDYIETKKSLDAIDAQTRAALAEGDK